MHWINFPLLFLMIYSGLLIYWADSHHEGLYAHEYYRVGLGHITLFRLFPSWFYERLGLTFQLAKGLGYHFFFMWFFAVNGIAYVLYALISGEWRFLVPNRQSFKEAVQVTLHDLGLRKDAPPRRKFNGAQQIAYTAVILMGAGSLLTGLAIYKPTQLHELTTLFGGYEMARWFHFWLTMGFVAFFVIHVIQVIRAGWNNFRSMIIGYEVVPVDSITQTRTANSLVDIQRRSRRGFLVTGIAALAGFGLWRWFMNQPQIDGLLAPVRESLEFNARISRTLFRPDALAPEFSPSRAVANFRRNGDIGLSMIDPAQWRLELIGAANPEKYRQYTADVMSWTYGQRGADSTTLVQQSQKPATHEQDAKGAAVTMKPMEMPEKAAGVPGLLLTMEQIRALPKTTMVTEFKCIEGWSEIVHWSGARLRDFLIAYPPMTRSGAPFDPRRPDDMPEYVGLETPDGEYYVGIEREVALHPQALLAYEINGAPLSMAHGAPLRLVTPLKYGIKQLKQIGRITYTDARPADYWAEQGYDYYSGH